jgi:two-component system, NarL family, response regulator LiaR
MTNNLITICIVQYNKSMMQFLKRQLHNKKDFNCTGIFLSGEDALLQIPGLSPAIVILDIHLPGINGIDCMKQLKQLCPGTQFMIYTEEDAGEDIFAALKAGAVSYLLHTNLASNMEQYVKELYNGGSPISSSIARKIILPYQQPAADTQKEYGITKREKEILLLLEKGNSYNKVADLLFISNKTVRKHICNIYEKMDVGSKTAALNKFFGRN